MIWTQKKLDRFIYLKKIGIPLDEIAKELGCTSSAAQTKSAELVKKGLVPKAPRGGKRTKKEDNIMDKNEKMETEIVAAECADTAEAKTETKCEVTQAKQEDEEAGGFIEGMTEPIVSGAPAGTTVKHSYSSKAVDLVKQCLKLADAAGIAITSLQIDVGEYDLELFGGSNTSHGSVVGVNEDGYTIKIDCHK